MPQRKVRSFFCSLGSMLGAVCLVATSHSLAQEADFAPFSPPSLLRTQSPGIIIHNATDDSLTIHEIPHVPELHPTIDLTAPTNNLWDRIRNGFAMTNLNDDLVLHYQQWYQNRPDALRRMVERSRPYLFHIVEELETRGMPSELALLPMVESAFNPNAYSRAHASGLWQFIPATGKRFNLEQNWWRDERRDVIASTSAALDYLQTIYDMHGDWHLALASYNWGEGAVKRAVTKNEARGLPTDYPNLTMPNETRHYVPKLQALKNILGDPVLALRLGVPTIPNEPYFVTLEAQRPMDVKTAARLANMSLEEFQRLNPSHNRPIIKPDTPVVIPADKLDHFRSNLENTKLPLTQWQAYTLTSPERLNQIADRFDTTASELARANGLSEKVRLGAGTTLLVPGGSGIGLHSLLNTAAPQQIIAPEPVVCRKVAKKGKRTTALSCRPSASTANDRPGKAGRGSQSAETMAKTGKKIQKSTDKLSAKSSAKAPGKSSAPTKAKTSVGNKPASAPRPAISAGKKRR